MPDLASVRVGVDGEGRSREEAYQVASVAAASVDRVLADYEAATDRVTTAALTVQPKTRWHKGETQRTGWQAARVTVVEIRDTAKVGEMLNALAGVRADISGLSWMVTPSNPSFALARQRAGEDAKARAEHYARALGVKLGPVAWACEPGLRTPSPMDRLPSPMAAPMAARAAAGGAAEESIDVAPEEVTIQASLEVGYTISDDGVPAGDL